MAEGIETSRHRVVIGASGGMDGLADGSVDLVVTSPPYPMVAMWDAGFAAADPRVGEALAAEDGERAFALMHEALEAVWAGCRRVLRDGGIACINVGDATRTIGGAFRLFSNHARVLHAMQALGFSVLPDVLWRKPTNAPNKFLGSGMLPAGAYVTYEHEYVLILRKGRGRTFATAGERARRRRSAFFWEERNVWFSDVWTDLGGAAQELCDPATRARSAAFPFELAHRLIQMHSLIGDTVLDPFLGTGTTMAAALASGRNAVGYESDPGLARTITRTLEDAARTARAHAAGRLDAHLAFVAGRRDAGRPPPRHVNRVYGFPVVTRQETDLELVAPTALERDGDERYTAALAPVTLADGGAAQAEFAWPAPD